MKPLRKFFDKQKPRFINGGSLEKYLKISFIHPTRELSDPCMSEIA